MSSSRDKRRGEVNVGLSVKFDVAALQRNLSPEQLSALMGGIAQCLGADADGPCPECGSRAWLPGPEGGMSQMFMCAGCKTEFVQHPGRFEKCSTQRYGGRA